MREIHDHKASATEPLIVAATDEPGHGGASHHYVIEAGDYPRMLTIQFQNGPIAEGGVNGVTNEALLAVVADRLRGFQKGRTPARRTPAR